MQPAQQKHCILQLFYLLARKFILFMHKAEEVLETRGLVVTQIVRINYYNKKRLSRTIRDSLF
jgi:hypothetical protein